MAVGPKAASLAAFLQNFFRSDTATFPFMGNPLVRCFGDHHVRWQPGRDYANEYQTPVGILQCGSCRLSHHRHHSKKFAQFICPHVYMLTYAFMIFGTFGIVILLGRKGDENLEIENYSGLAYKHPVLALSMTYFSLSLGGTAATGWIRR